MIYITYLGAEIKKNVQVFLIKTEKKVAA